MLTTLFIILGKIALFLTVLSLVFYVMATVAEHNGSGVDGLFRVWQYTVILGIAGAASWVVYEMMQL